MSERLITEETVFAPGPCALCGRDPAVGFASINDEWYCHGDLDEEPTCYMRAGWGHVYRAKRVAE